jgi:glycosyltransferase involved in cell wall biosynthesis
MAGGGAQRAVTILLRHLDRRRFEPLLALFERQGPFLEQVPADVPIVDLKGRHPLLAGWAMVALARAIRKIQPAVVLASMRWPSLAAAACKRLRPDTRVVLWALGHVEQAIAGHRLRAYRLVVPRLVRCLYPRVDGIIAVSEGVKENLVQTFGVPAERVRVIPNPLEIEQVQTRAAEETALTLDWSVPTVVAVGRLTAQKGFRYLLDAFATLAGTRPCRLLIVGDGPERAALWRQAQTLGLQRRVVLAGFQANPFAYVARSTVFALPSLWEGHPFVLMEAMACGVPVVSTDCPSGPSELITDGDNGLLVPTANPTALARAIAALLADPPLARSLAQSALERLNDYRVEPFVRRWEHTLEAIGRSR